MTAARVRVNGILASEKIARFQHECGLCERTIEKGERYLWVNGYHYAKVCIGHADLDDPLVGAICGLCGATADNFHVPDDLWERVGLGSVQACFKCFRIAAWHAGVKNDGNPWEVRLAS